MHSRVHDSIATVWRLESARIVASVARMVRDVGVAEELAQDALVAALEHWPRQGLPDKPAAWLMTTAKHRALDHLRHHQMAQRQHEGIAADLEAAQAHVVPDFVDALDAARQDEIGDDLLRLIFTACHPVLPTDARVALTLKLLGGLSTHEIARAYLVPEATIAQRIVRAKRTLGEARVPFDLPPGAALAERLAAVLEVVYLIFNEGYTATRGADWMRPALCDEALRLGRMLTELAPDQAEVQGLLALMEIQASRTAARTDAGGQPVLLAEQNRARWDHLLIRRGLAALARAPRRWPAPQLPAAGRIAAQSARRRQDTDWARTLYAQLARGAITRGRLNRVVVVSARGLSAAWPSLNRCGQGPAALPLMHAVQGDLLVLGPGRGRLRCAGPQRKLETSKRALLERRAGIARAARQ
jgi:RNA polymerase sigma factor (sigma-70 family)